MPTPLPVLHDWRLSVDYEGIAWALMDREGESANSMGRRFTEELGEIVKFVEDAARQGEVKGLVIMSAKKSGFLVGADIREFERFDTEARDQGGGAARRWGCSTASRSCRCPWLPPSTAIASAAGSSLRSPATTASPIATRRRVSASRK